MKQEIEEPADNHDQIQKEATGYYDLAKTYRRERYMKPDQDGYVINRKWLAQWKVYCDYGYVKKNTQSSYYYSKYSPLQYTPKPTSKPGTIDNGTLLVKLDEFLNDGDQTNPENCVIRHDVNLKTELKIVNEAIWKYFLDRYYGGPEIKKKLILEDSRSYRKTHELLYRKLNFVLLPKRKQCYSSDIQNLTPQNLYISRTKTLLNLKEKLCTIAKKMEMYKPENEALTSNPLSNEQFRLWKLNSNTKFDEFKMAFALKANEIRESSELVKTTDLIYIEDIPNIDLAELELADTDICFVEYSTETSPWMFEVKVVETKSGSCEWCRKQKILRYCCECKSAWYCSEVCKQRNKYSHSRDCTKGQEHEERPIKESGMSKRGIVGLQNLGNTCFMNTSLQCISACHELTQYFLKDYYLEHINVNNPIGSAGVLAKAYADLLKNLWYGDINSHSPWNFKKAIGSFQSMFSGYQQHDTQEFLNYLLDGLHEDLNKVLRKPLVETDQSSKDDAIKSRESWINFLRRNQSLLVDLLYGQYKSTLYCPDTQCQNISTSFDPFLSISLPLVPKTDTYEVTCYFIFFNLTAKPLQLKLPFSIETTIMALRNKVAKILDIHPFSFFIIRFSNITAYDRFVSSTALLKTNSYFSSDNDKPFFLFQIDPNMFYSIGNKYFLQDESLIRCIRDYSTIRKSLDDREEENKKLFSDDYEENENGATSEQVCYYSPASSFTRMSGTYLYNQKINVDDNYGFFPDFIAVVVGLYQYETYSYSGKKCSVILFPRTLYLNKKWTTKQIHYYIFKYFAPLIRTKHNLSEVDFPDDILWEKMFCNFSIAEDTNTYEYQKKVNWPYRLKLKNFNATKLGNCPYCNKSNCDDCLLPFNNEITLDDLLKRVPQNEHIDIDNTFYFLSEKQRTYSYVSENRDLQLVTVWLPEYEESIFKLKEKTDYDFHSMKSIRRNAVSIYDCFKNFSKKETLEAGNEWYCPQCKQHQKATKKMEIYNSPNILIIHLKRFKNASKIDTVVDFPIDGLDLTNFVLSNQESLPLQYDLFAIANHYGSIGFGHYIAYAKNPIDQKWYEFDDSRVTRKNVDELVGSSAYVLFYRRKQLETSINIEDLYKKKFINFEQAIVSPANSAMTDSNSNTTPANGDDIGNILGTTTMEIDPNASRNPITTSSSGGAITATRGEGIILQASDIAAGNYMAENKEESKSIEKN